MKTVIVLLALVALSLCGTPPAACGTTTSAQTATEDGGWGDAIAIPDAAIQCFSVNATATPDSTANYTLVIAARFDTDSASTNTSILSIWNADGLTAFQSTNVTESDDSDSLCVVTFNLTLPSGPVQADGTVYYSISALSNGTKVNLWNQYSEDPVCGVGVELSGGGNFWIWIIVAVVIVVIIAVIIAGAGAFVYYQKKKKGQAKLYEDS